MTGAIRSRTREFGLRSALGAGVGDLIYEAIRAELKPIAAGAAVGVVAALVVRLLLKTYFGRLSLLDPATCVAVGAACAAVSTCAAIWAAMRLRRFAPAEALRRA
jgi:ABC-type antimicrobial peptide transport system permease subunit